MHSSHRRIAVAAAALATAFAVPAAVFGAQPVFRDHETEVDGPYRQNWCGAVAGMETDTGMFTFKGDANGSFHVTSVFKGVFTADATGKSLELAGAGVDMGTGVDNGDGTTTFTEHTAGLAIRFKTADGGILKDADGKPILGAGSIDSVAVIDNATGDFISGSETFHGPHPLHDGVDVCGPSIAYLTSP
jgi:hypothetical protein